MRKKPTNLTLLTIFDRITSYRRNTPNIPGYFNGRRDAFNRTLDVISEAHVIVDESALDYFIDVDMDKFPFLIAEKQISRITFAPTGDVARLTVGEFIDKLEKYGCVKYPS